MGKQRKGHGQIESDIGPDEECAYIHYGVGKAFFYLLPSISDYKSIVAFYSTSIFTYFHTYQILSTFCLHVCLS